MHRSRSAVTRRDPTSSRAGRRLRLQKARLLERRAITYGVLKVAAEQMLACVAAIDDNRYEAIEELACWDVTQLNLCQRVMIDIDEQVASIDARMGCI